MTGWLQTFGDLLGKYGTTLGLITATVALVFNGCQTKLQRETLRDNRSVESARFIIEMDQYLNQDRYETIAAAIEGTDSPHSGAFLILKKHGGEFTPAQIDDYLGNYDDIGILYKNRLIDREMAYDEFSYDVEKAYCNKDVWGLVTNYRQASKDLNSSHSFYKPFQDLAEAFLKTDNYTCSDLDGQ